MRHAVTIDQAFARRSGPAAEQLELPLPRIYQLCNAGMLPFRRNPEGRRLYRPGQIAVIARARKVRLQRGN